MRDCSLYATAWLISLSICHASNSPPQAPLTDTAPSHLRRATLDDADDITTVFVDAFKVWDAWKYVYQFEDQVDPAYTWTCARDMFRNTWLNQTGPYANIFNVIAVPDDASPTGDKVVSIAYWNLAFVNATPTDESLPPPHPMSLFGSELAGGLASASKFDCAANLDANLTRARQVHGAMEEANEKLLHGRFAPLLELALLATHPDWDGNGFAARHLRWGKAKLAELNRAREPSEARLPITLMATPAGYPLYVSEGFESLRNVTVERFDGKGVVWQEAMKFEDDYA